MNNKTKNLGYSKDQIFKLLRGGYRDQKGAEYIFEWMDDFWLLTFEFNDLFQEFVIHSLEDLYFANEFIRTHNGQKDYIQGVCRNANLDFLEYEKIRQTIIRSFV